MATQLYHERPHQALGCETPFKVYTSGNENLAPGLVKVDCLCTFRWHYIRPQEFRLGFSTRPNLAITMGTSSKL